MSQGPAYRIQTARLVLRCWNPGDAPLLKSALDASLEHLRPWMPWAYNEPKDIQKTIDWLRHCRSNFDRDEDYVYGVFDSQEATVLGSTGLHTRLGSGAREIGYWIHKDHTSQGLATELSAALTRVAFEIEKVHRVEIHCDPDNVRSAAVPRKLGYRLEATLGERIQKHDGTWRDTMVWTMFEHEYPNSPAGSAPIKAFDAAGVEISLPR